MTSFLSAVSSFHKVKCFDEYISFFNRKERIWLLCRASSIVLKFQADIKLRNYFLMFPACLEDVFHLFFMLVLLNLRDNIDLLFCLSG